MRLRLVPQQTSIDFLKLRKIAATFSILFVLASIALFSTKGLNYGIDFRGGTLIEAETQGPADLAGMRSVLSALDLGDVAIQEFGAPTEVLIRVEQQAGGDAIQQDVVELVQETLTATYDGINFRRVEVVGPKVSGELIIAGLTAVLSAIAAVLIYIWFRFEWQFSAGAVIALVHDVLLTIGVFSLIGIEFNLSIIAAILTIVGYSLNDTVVVYDRVRENLRKYKKMPLDGLINQTLNETLSRTSMTSVTTLLALAALYVLGPEVIKGFTFAMIWGVIVGTYSSVYIAAPLLLMTGVKRDWSKEAAQAAERP